MCGPELVVERRLLREGALKLKHPEKYPLRLKLPHAMEYPIFTTNVDNATKLMLEY